MAVCDERETANAKVAGLSLDALAHTQLLGLKYRREVVVRSLPTVDHQIINRLAAEADPKRRAAPRWPMSWLRNWVSRKSKPVGGSRWPSCSGRGRR
jgi:hypothetical protein